MLYHFTLEISDIDRGVYETLDFRLAQHPSETGSYLLTRVLAFALSYVDGLEFSSAGLSDPEAPAMKSLGVHGGNDLWIEIGNPSARKLHKASKAARQVVVYTYKNPEVLLEDLRANQVHRGDEILIFAFDPPFLQALEERLEKNNRWSVLHQQGHVDVEMAGFSLATEVRPFSLRSS
jgi:uncharacterized protein YaeQ